jgi:cytochrome c oxidase subunit 2
MLGVSIAVTAFVVVMGAWGIVRGRRRSADDVARVVPWGDRFVLVAGLGVTSAILVAFFFVSVRSMATLAAGTPREGLEIVVTGHDWWWEVRYPNGAVTANEIHVPAGERVRLKLLAADVMHSFWVPQLGPKTDLIPGRENAMWLEADEPGRYRGQCAEFCGLQHAHMAVFVVADPPEVFRDWVRAMAGPAAAPADAKAARGKTVFESSTCAGCHTIRGTTADGTLGPDLTHLATRSTIASGTIRLTETNLLHWILDPQDVKLGATMPPTALTDDEVRSLTAYLLGLR